MYCYEKLPLSSIHPQGILKAQLNLQLKGLTGHIDGLFKDLDLNNAWLGGTGEAWERGPYYLTGLIPLGFLTGDSWALERIELWVNAILISQDDTGNFGPKRTWDWWPRMVALKALTSYFQATEDQRILDFMEKYFRYQYENIDQQPLHFWASARAFESMEAINLVYSLRPQEFLLELVEKLRDYSYDFFDLFEHFTYSQPMTEYISKPLFNLGKEIVEILDNQSKKSLKVKSPPSSQKTLDFNQKKTVALIMKTHGVNLAMALKYPATYGAFTGHWDLTQLCRQGYEALHHYHGNCTGLFSCDEHVMGMSPAQGIELCTVVEMMYSLEEIGRVTGETWAFELLEYIAYNALPATFTPDMTAHQYVQQPNQVGADGKRRQFFDTDKYANTFGLAPNYGCCASNMHAGFPLFAGYLALRHDKGFAFMVYGACRVSTDFKGAPLEIVESSNYPFDSRIEFRVIKAKGEVDLHFRRIENRDFSMLLNGQAVEVETDLSIIKLQAKAGDTIEILCPPRLNIVTNPDGSKSIKYGNLLMALGLKAEEKYIKGPRPYHDRAFVSRDDFNKTPIIVNNELIIEDVIFHEPGAQPFEVPPILLTVKGRMVDNWGLTKHSANMPKEPVFGQSVILTLVPYGTTRLRIAQFPAGALDEENK